MERPPSLNGYMEQTDLPFDEALAEWQIVVAAFRTEYLKTAPKMIAENPWADLSGTVVIPLS